MAAAARFVALSLLGLIAGAILGGIVGLGGGLAWTSLAGTSGFEGYSGFVVAYWILGGIIAGAVIGLILGAKRARRG